MSPSAPPRPPLPADKAFHKFVARHALFSAEQAARIADALPWVARHTLIVPAFAESPQLAWQWHHLDADQVLIIVIINCPDSANHADQQQTEHCYQALCAQGRLRLTASPDCPVTLTQPNERHCLLIVDARASCASFTRISGVGFARRLGADLACHLVALGACRSAHLHSSDADASLPANYFTSGADTAAASATLIYPFRHCDLHAQPASLAGQLYDMTLRYYVLGLHWSGSPWAFHTLGSTLAIPVQQYAVNRGFPLRDAGEDFYLLNKLAKTGPVLQLAEPQIVLSDRASLRVPFGTGPAVRRIQSLADCQQDLLLYHPGIFAQLREWHAVLPELADHPAHPFMRDTLIGQVITALGLPAVLIHCHKQASSTADFCFRLMQWFDAFRTLKTVHGLRARGFGSVPLQQWCSLAKHGEIPFITPPPSGDAYCSDFLQALIDAVIAQDQRRLPSSCGLIAQLNAGF